MRLTGNMVPHSYVLTSLHYGLAEQKKKKLFCFVAVVGLSDSGWYYRWRRCHEDNWNAHSKKQTCLYVLLKQARQVSLSTGTFII